MLVVSLLTLFLSIFFTFPLVCEGKKEPQDARPVEGSRRLRKREARRGEKHSEWLRNKYLSHVAQLLHFLVFAVSLATAVTTAGSSFLFFLFLFLLS
jgi:hypothetical protein